MSRRIAALLAGPTASGKSAAAVRWARARGWEILGCDSRQAYRGLAIGTGAPTVEEREGVVHHLVGVVDPRERLTVAGFVDRALGIAATDGPDLLVVGGTGQYLESLLRGLEPAPAPDPSLRAELEAELAASGPAGLWRSRLGGDPPAECMTNPARALRRVEKTLLVGLGAPAPGRPAAAPGAPVLALAIPRAELHARIERRVATMLRSGWLDEIADLRGQGYAPGDPGCDALGYRDLWGFREESSVPMAIVGRIVAATRQYAKRQETWLRHRLVPDAWIDGTADADRVALALEEAFARLPAARGADPSGSAGDAGSIANAASEGAPAAAGHSDDREASWAVPGAGRRAGEHLPARERAVRGPADRRREA